MKSNRANVGKVACFAGCAVAIVPLVAFAASEPTSPAADTGESGVYHDHYLAAGLPADISTDDAASADPDGLARSLRVDGVGVLLSSHYGAASDDLNESGILFDSQWDTVAFGAWSLDGSWRLRGSADGVPGDSHGMLRVSERGMAFDGGWNADAGIGDLTTPNINLARSASRFFLPTGPMQGFSMQWRGPSGLQLIAGAGEPGIYQGIVVPSFSALGGVVGTLGAQWSPAAHWSMGGELATARDAPQYAGVLTAGSDRASASTGLFSTAWQGESASAQLNLLDGGVSGMGHSLGTWLDALTHWGRISQSFGVVRVDPNLTWGNQLITSDVQGGYYQFDYQSRRWFADLGVDQAWSVSGRGPLDSTFLTADARYQFSRDVGFGGVINVRRSSGPIAWSGETYLDTRNDWGIGRGQLDYASNNAEREVTLSLSEGWDTIGSSHVSTALGYERITADSALVGIPNSSAATLSINGRSELTARMSLDGSVRWDRPLSGSRASGLMANVALDWQVAPDWAVLASYYESRLGSWTALAVTSPLAPPIASPIPAARQRGLFLTIRYQRSAGQHFAPLGGAPGSGSGRLTGTIYLDANDNSRFDANEAVAHSVTVILDGRFSTVTDGNGRFDFPAVATGHHVITVVPDNLPLPWTVVGDGHVEADVHTRERTDVAIPVVRNSILTRQVE